MTKSKDEAPKSFISDELPQYLRERGPSVIGKEDSLREDHAFWAARALLVGQYRNDPDRLENMVHSTMYLKARALPEWHDLMEEYPERSFEEGKIKKPLERDVPERAFILKNAILSLLKVVCAPGRIIHDVEIFLDSFLENPARAKERVQLLRLQNPDLSWAEICRMAEVSDRQVRKDKQDGTIMPLPPSR